jgi:hypothetical protein
LVFEVVQNLTGDHDKTFKGIDKGSMKIIIEQVTLFGGLNLWSEAVTNSKNSHILKFIEDKTQVDRAVGSE